MAKPTAQGYYLVICPAFNDSMTTTKWNLHFLGKNLQWRGTAGVFDTKADAQKSAAEYRRLHRKLANERHKRANARKRNR